jgi:hypothetical protein
VLRSIGFSLAVILCAASLRAEPGIVRSPVSRSNAHGRAAVKSFNLETPEQPPETKMQTVEDVMGKISMPKELLRASSGRVQLFSIARLTEQDMANPFEIRVQVAVDVQETMIEIGGIIEGVGGQRSTAIIIMHPPNVRAAGTPEGDSGKPGAGKPGAAKGGSEKPVSRVCSVGDVVEGFRVHMILRDSLILEQAEKFLEVPRGHPVTVSVPLSAL